MRIKRLLGAFAGILFFFVLPVQAALPEEISLTASDPENGYRYEWDHYGGFYTNVLQGGNTDFAYFSIDEELDYQMLKDGEVYAYTQEDLLLENGSYILYLFTKEEEAGENCCAFCFQIVSDDYTGAMPFTDIEVKESEMSFSYDREQGAMRFMAEEQELLMTNIPNGAVVAAPVYMKPADGVTQTVYRNGEYISRPEGDIYEEEGFYECVQMIYPDQSYSGAEDHSVIKTVFYFRIVGGRDQCVNVIGAPDGFSLERVVYQGMEQEISPSGYYFLQGEGDYRFYFAAAQDAGLSYTLDLTKDAVAPFLDFNQEVEDGTAAAPLLMTCGDASCSYKVLRNGMKYDYVQGEALMAGGYYEVTVSDEYGNSRKYTFMLEAAYKFFSPGMLLLLSSAAVILVIVLYRSGHDLKVV